jgi:hypothetical protein
MAALLQRINNTGRLIGLGGSQTSYGRSLSASINSFLGQILWQTVLPSSGLSSETINKYFRFKFYKIIVSENHGETKYIQNRNFYALTVVCTPNVNDPSHFIR